MVKRFVDKRIEDSSMQNFGVKGFVSSALVFVVYLFHQMSLLQILLYYTVLLSSAMLSPKDFENQTKVSIIHISPIVGKVVDICIWLVRYIIKHIVIFRWDGCCHHLVCGCRPSPPSTGTTTGQVFTPVLSTRWGTPSSVRFLACNSCLYQVRF